MQKIENRRSSPRLQAAALAVVAQGTERPFAGVSGATAVSLMTRIRKPTAVNASDIARSGQAQKLSNAVWPPTVHSSVKLQVAR